MITFIVGLDGLRRQLIFRNLRSEHAQIGMLSVSGKLKIFMHLFVLQLLACRSFVRRGGLEKYCSGPRWLTIDQ